MVEENTFKVEEQEIIYDIKHRAYYLAKNIIEFIGLVKFDRIYFSMFDQLLRSASSISANLVEGIAGSSKNDFIKFYTIALKSANETKYWLCLIRDTIKEIDKKLIHDYLKETDEISKIIASIIIKTKK